VSCKAIRNKLSAYLDGELAGFEMLDIRSHLHRCGDCEKEYEELRRLKRLISSMPEGDPGEDFAQKLKDRVFRPSHLKPGPVPVAMISGLAFVAALLVSLAAFHRQPGPAAVTAGAAQPSASASFDLARDQAYQNGGDLFSDAPMVIPAQSQYNVH